MRRIFISSLALACFIATSFQSQGQCTVSGTGAPATPDHTFNSNAEGFVGFTASGGVLNSTLGAGTKELITPVFFLLPGASSFQISFDLGKTTNATADGYTIVAERATGNTTLCSGGALSFGTNVFTIPTTGLVPASTNFKVHIFFTMSGNSTASLTVDNFSSSAQDAAGALPVKFSSFEAKTAGAGVNLNWYVSSEENVNGYEIERSIDGSTFQKIGFVKAQGMEKYSYTDTKPLTGNTSYYRVKSVDLDGRFLYSTVAAIKGGKASIILKAFPQPAQADLTIQHGTAVKGSLISISSEDGRTIKSVVPATGTQQTTVNLSAAKPGLYLVRFENANGEVETIKVIKQ